MEENSKKEPRNVALTPEMLLKNGFEQVFSRDTNNIFKLRKITVVFGCDCHIIKGWDKDEVQKIFWEFFQSPNERPIYVLEFLSALRILGMKELANNFKID